jgi:aminoglycoside phosphotransferase (APT) family kinase protein
MNVSSVTGGFDTSVVNRWLTTISDVQMPVSWSRLPGGHSNLTYLLRDATGRELVIRRPPEGPLVPRAHDMWREYRVIEALWPTSVKVPEPIAYCNDPAVADVHFYVMSRVPGAALYTSAETERWLDIGARQRAGDDFIDVLAELHAMDPAEIGLDNLGRADGYMERQVSRWYRSWLSQVGASGFDDPRVHQLHDLLSQSIPEQCGARIVHGDYGPHNVLFERSGAISAVVDWEMATIGDPLADLAYSVNAWVGPGDAPIDRPDVPTALEGFPDREQVVERYVRQTGVDLSRLTYYRIFNFWKRACILQGVYVRYSRGQKRPDGVDVPEILVRLGRFLDAAASLAGELT